MFLMYFEYYPYIRNNALKYFLPLCMLSFKTFVNYRKIFLFDAVPFFNFVLFLAVTKIIILNHSLHFLPEGDYSSIISFFSVLISSSHHIIGQIIHSSFRIWVTFVASIVCLCSD